ncbi:hypothetical protein LLY39_17145 [Flavobacterium anhuiense]|nr:hypothetical protein [Flavobacterium anhuiense]URM36135.1 hypothetical protein LLY39_17145 [Flavobacterium anhuiense]
MMQRGKFDITKLINRKAKNVLNILVSIPKQPLNNYGSPTYISSAGWDWMPYVPGLNSGITDDVFLTNTDKVTIADPWIHTNLPTNARADLEVKVDLKNTSSQNQEGVLTGVIMPGNITFSKKINLDADGITSVKLTKEQFPNFPFKTLNYGGPMVTGILIYIRASLLSKLEM